MGFSLTWYAVPDKHAETLIRELLLEPTGEMEEDIQGRIHRLVHELRVVLYLDLTMAHFRGTAAEGVASL